MSIDPNSNAPRVDTLIADVMKRFPGVTKAAQARYYEEVHQHLAPLARELEAEVARLRVALYSPAPAISEREDAARLDFLDAMNTRKNEQNGTRYGWRLSENHNRIALEDHAWPAASVREAIDAARKEKQS